MKNLQRSKIEFHLKNTYEQTDLFCTKKNDFRAQKKLLRKFEFNTGTKIFLGRNRSRCKKLNCLRLSEFFARNLISCDLPNFVQETKKVNLENLENTQHFSYYLLKKHDIR